MPKKIFQPNGHVVLTINGTEYDCRPPTLEEYADLTSKALTIGNTIKANIESDKSTGDRMDEVVELQKGWYIAMLDTLSATPYEQGPEKLPPWIVSNLSILIQNHWAEVPLELLGQEES